MSLFSLPGAAAVPLALSWLSPAGGVGATSALIQEGSLQAVDAAILLPMMMAMGGQLQRLGRGLNVAKPPPKYYKAIFIVFQMLKFLYMPLI